MQPVPADPNRRPKPLAMESVLDLLIVEAYRAGMVGEDRASPSVEVCRAVVSALLSGNNDPVWVADAAAAHLDHPAAYRAAASIRSFLR